MSRQIKTVSIPDRLRARVESIENFSGFVVAALENEDQAISALRIAALHRQITAIREEIIDDLSKIAIDLGNARRSNNPKTVIGALAERVEEFKRFYAEEI